MLVEVPHGVLAESKAEDIPEVPRTGRRYGHSMNLEDQRKHMVVHDHEGRESGELVRLEQ